MPDFVHLHCHSEFSILECPNRIKALVQRAKACGMPALALTDNATMYGALEFYQQARKEGINPLIGADLYVCSNMSIKERWSSRLVALATSFKGYQNLMKMVSQAHLEGVYYKPRVDMELVSALQEDVIVISPGGRGPVAGSLERHQDDQAREWCERLKDVFGDRFYLGVQRLGRAHEELVEHGTLALSESLEIPIVAMNDVYTMEADEAPLRDILFCIQTGKQMDDQSGSSFDVHEAYFKSSEEMYQRFSDRPEWLAQSVQIAARCHLDIDMEQVLLPSFDCPDGKSPEVYLEELVWQGIDLRYKERTSEIQERVSFELGIINKMKYANYFLIIFDFLDFCTKQGIPVGPGRGSAAGSIVAYALDITKCDPIKYKLLFERFLNPERVSMPDIDIDFCIKRRQEVIDYIVERYGQACVSQIITFGTMQARAVIRDVGRALGVPLADVDRIAKLIPSTPGSYTSIPDAIEQIKELKEAHESGTFSELLDTAIKLEGLTRHTSTHAAGVVISRDPLETVVPMTQNDGLVATQYAMADIERIGLLKMDILGLRNLTVIDDTVRLIKDNHGVSLDIDAISMEDEATYQHLSEGFGVGVFQCESKGMRQLMKDMKPSVFEDVIALLALYRPGPLGSGMVSDFVSNKLGETEVQYALPQLESILNETYGMIVYQEQVMQIASVIGGFSLGQADMLRRAMGKKKKDVMDEMRLDFLDGAKAQNVDAKKANDVFDLCYKFAEYGFNKSHSTAYALISYQTAFLKTHYPAEYMASLLSSVVSNSDKTAAYIQECANLNMKVLLPSVNESKYNFTIVQDADDSSRKAIRFGLGAIKNVGDGAIESIVEEAPFKDLSDFCMRVDLRQCNKRVIESLIKSGAFDDLGERSYLLAIFEAVMDKAQVLIRERSNGQVSLFADNHAGGGLCPDDYHTDDYHIFSPAEMLKNEKEMLGLYISGHPLDSVRERLEAVKTPIQSFKESDTNSMVTVTGFLSECRRIITRKKKEMMLGTLEDLTGNLTLMLFHDESFEDKVPLFQDDHIVTVTGRIRVTADEMSLMCKDIVLVERTSGVRSLYIDVDNVEMHILKQIKQLNLQFKGTLPVYFKCHDETIQAHQKFWVKDDALFHQQLEYLLGKGRTWIV